MAIKEKLITCINLLTETELSTLFKTATLMLESRSGSEKPDCPHCGHKNVIKYGHKCGKQRFLCKDCTQTFVTTTNTVMSHSHFPKEIWDEVIDDTIGGNAIDYTAKRLGTSHQTVLSMRHKILSQLQKLHGIQDICLSEVSEFDETFVLDCYKGRQFAADASRPARRHGAKAQKRGISNEYVCICTGVQRKGHAHAATVNRAKPDAEEIKEIFRGHIADGTLAICDGLRSYNALRAVADCSIVDCNGASGEEKCFYNLNTVNNFHSFIKARYNFYRGVATKYLNRYNALFAATYKCAADLIKRAKEALLQSGSTNHYLSNREVLQTGLLVI